MEHVIAVAYFAKYLDFIYLFINFKTCFGFYVRTIACVESGHSSLFYHKRDHEILWAFYTNLNMFILILSTTAVLPLLE